MVHRPCVAAADGGGSLEHIVVAKSVAAQQKGFEEKAGGTHEGLVGNC